MLVDLPDEDEAVEIMMSQGSYGTTMHDFCRAAYRALLAATAKPAAGDVREAFEEWYDIRHGHPPRKHLMGSDGSEAWDAFQAGTAITKATTKSERTLWGDTLEMWAWRVAGSITGGLLVAAVLAAARAI